MNKLSKIAAIALPVAGACAISACLAFNKGADLGIDIGLDAGFDIGFDAGVDTGFDAGASTIACSPEYIGLQDAWSETQVNVMGGSATVFCEGNDPVGIIYNSDGPSSESPSVSL